MGDERPPADLPDDLPEGLPEGLEQSPLHEWIEQARSEMDGPRGRRVEGEVLQRVHHRVHRRVDDLPRLPVETRLRLIEVVRETIQHLLCGPPHAGALEVCGAVAPCHTC